MFLDHVELTVTAGGGGDGASSFRHEAHVPRGGPDGGDGGRGGSVNLVVDAGLTTLADYRFKHHFRAPVGSRGEGSRRHGKSGRDLDIPVPPGTVVFDATSGDLIADLVAKEQSVTIAKGGRGGMGNVHFASSTHRAPTHAQKGEPGEEHRIRLELRLIADIGLVGLPNAGKSTILGAITAADPKIADYPFTTLTPNLGVLDLDVRDPDDHRRPTIADLPGLIEGASSGAGLGHAFLRHVQRTRVVAHVVDLGARDPEWDFRVIREELEQHDARLLEKPTLVVANKIDLPGAADRLVEFTAARAADGLPVVPISARERTGLDALLAAVAELLPDAETLARPGEPAGVVVHRFDATETGFAVEATEDGFRVNGRRVERLAAQTNFDNEESAERFQRTLARMGVERELIKAGVSNGDTVHIGSIALEWDGQAWA